MSRATTRLTRKSGGRSTRYRAGSTARSMTGSLKKSLGNIGTGLLYGRTGGTHGSRSGKLWLTATENTTGQLSLTRHARSPIHDPRGSTSRLWSNNSGYAAAARASTLLLQHRGHVGYRARSMNKRSSTG